MRQEEYNDLPHILTVDTGGRIGTEIATGGDSQTLLLLGAMTVGAIKSIKEEDRESAIRSLRRLLKKYPEWINDPEFNTEWEEQES